MIWEVDEDCDGTINWPEFQACWQRCQEDKAGAQHRAWLPARRRMPTRRQLCHHRLLSLSASAGTEPRGLYNVVLFLLHDRGCSGRVTLEEVMKITYLRVGKVGRRGRLPGCGCCRRDWDGLWKGCLGPG